MSAMPSSIVETPSVFARLRARVGGAAIGLVDQSIVSAANFMVVVLLARYLTPTEFGVFMIAQTALVLLTGLQNTIVAQPHNILGAQRNGIEYTRLTAVLGLTQVVVSVAVSIVAVAVGFAFAAFDRESYAQLSYALALTIPPWMAQEFARRVLYTQNHMRSAALNDAVAYGLQVLGVVIVVTETMGVAATPVNAMLSLAVAYSIASALGCWQLREHLAPAIVKTLPEMHSLRRFVSTVAETWRLSKWLAGQQVVNWIGTNAYGWLIAGMMGPAAFGLYRAAYQVVNVLNPIRQATMNVFPSHVARVYSSRGFSGAARWTGRMTLALSLPFVACALVIALAAKPIADLMYGANIALPDLIPVVFIGALIYVINFARTPLDFLILVVGGGRPIFIRALWLMAFIWTGGIALIYAWGVVGAMISELVGALLAITIAARLFTRLRRDARTKSPVTHSSNSVNESLAAVA